MKRMLLLNGLVAVAFAFYLAGAAAAQTSVKSFAEVAGNWSALGPDSGAKIALAIAPTGKFSVNIPTRTESGTAVLEGDILKLVAAGGAYILLLKLEGNQLKGTQQLGSRPALNIAFSRN